MVTKQHEAQDVDGAFAALAARTRERLNAEQVARDAEQRVDQDLIAQAAHALLATAEARVTALRAAAAPKPTADFAAWRRAFSPILLDWIDKAIKAGVPLDDVMSPAPSGTVPTLQRLVEELAGPGLLTPERLRATETMLNELRDVVARIPHDQMTAYRARADAVAEYEATQRLLTELIAWHRLPPKALAELAQHRQQQAAMPVPPAPPHRGPGSSVQGAKLDGSLPTAVRAPASTPPAPAGIENLKGV